MPQLPANLASQLEEIIRETGKFMHDEFMKFDKGRIEQKKGHKDLVSYVDKTAEKMLSDGCSLLLPGSGFIMEETGEVNETSDYRWIIDPLDGTTNFVHGVPIYTISLALQHKAETIYGVVFDIERDEYFAASKGNGATLNGRPIRVSGAPRLAESLMVTGFPYAISDIARDYLAVLSEFVQNAQGLRRLGSAALDLAWTAAGRFDGYYEIRLNPWDVAAGALLVKEAGGAVSDFSGTDNYVFGRQIVASNGLIHEEVRKTIISHLKL